MAATFVLKRSGDEFMFNLVASNGRVVLTSERYTAKASALDGVASVRENATQPERYEASADNLRFTLRAANGRVIGTSEAYSSPEAAREGMEAVSRAAREAGMDDQT